MRLLAGWLCLSLASVWLARRMWTLRSPLTRSLYVNMTSGPGGPAAPAGGRKENHQVRSGQWGEGVAGQPSRARRPLCGVRPRPLGKFPRPVHGRGAFCYLPGRGGPCVSAPGPRVGARDPHCSRAAGGGCRCSATSAHGDRHLPGTRPEIEKSRPSLSRRTLSISRNSRPLFLSG